jgi:chemotaxis protein methyltransferase CheR
MKGTLGQLASLVSRETGIALPAAREDALRTALRRVAPDTDAAGFLRAVADPGGGSQLLGRLIDEVTVQETFFARDIAQLRVIPWASLRAWRARGGPGGPVRVWSAGCATGEEAYTLALEAVLALGCPPGPLDVLGTDISAAALATAAAGRYGERAVRLLAPGVRERYLTRQPDGRYQVTGQLRALARFRWHNLALDPGPPPGEAAFDVVVCRNVLIYLSTQLIARAVGNLERALRPGGVLVLGAADVLHRTAARKAASGPAPAPREPAPPRIRPLISNASSPVAATSRRQRLAAALEAADAGHRLQALAEVSGLLASAPDDAEANFVFGLILLERDDPAGAARALRRALHYDPSLGLAAFTLGRACDRLGDPAAARAAYQHALRALDPADQRHELILQQIDIRDVAAACRARLGGTS